MIKDNPTRDELIYYFVHLENACLKHVNERFAEENNNQEAWQYSDASLVDYVVQKLLHAEAAVGAGNPKQNGDDNRTHTIAEDRTAEAIIRIMAYALKHRLCSGTAMLKILGDFIR